MRNPTILVADDDRQFLTMMALHLRRANYEVLVAQDSFLALQLALKCVPDLLLLDVNMPAGDGFTVHERLRTKSGGATPPIIFLSGENSNRVRFKAAGAFRLLHKPVEISALLAVMHTALRGSRQQSLADQTPLSLTSEAA
jgi:DNA-binding response OmpR family regulator